MAKVRGIGGRTLPAMLRAQVDAGATRKFVKCGGDWLSFGDVDQLSDRVASGLAELGVAKGDRVALVVPNRQELLEVFFGAAKLGAITVPLNVFLKGEFLRYQIIDSGAVVVVVDASGYEAMLPILADTAVRHVVVIDEVDTASCPVHLVDFATLASSTSTVPMAAIEARDLMAISFTSGTTGMPKGCMLSHGYYTVMHRPYFEPGGWFGPEDSFLTPLPLYNAGGHGLFLMFGLCGGIPVTFEPTFSASTFMARVKEEGATVVTGTGMSALAILALPPSPDDAVNPLKFASWVPLPPAKQTEFGARFGCETAQGTFGQTERVPTTMMPFPPPPDKRSTSGKAVPEVELMLVDDDDEEVPTGEVGEILVRPRVSHGMFSGYWQKPEATAAAWSNLWHHTGDTGKLDDDGFLTFVDRKKDSMRRRGFNVSSSELEQALILHPKVHAVAAFAVPSEMTEDDIMVAIVPVPDASPEPGELFEFFREVLPYFAIPRYVDIRESLPVNGLDRVMKHVLRAQGRTPTTWDLTALGLSVAASERR